jgi:XTP/dITP diphosphohydrolase
MKLVFASNNQGKIQEINALLAPFDIRIIPQSELGIKEAEESGLSFIENALIKARNASSIARMAALADDSGLIVPALSGMPGIYSARYAGAKADSAQNIKKLLSKLQHVEEADRTAYFYCVMVLMRHPHDPCPLIGEGIWHGRILHSPRGEHGFGYDPIFFDLTHQTSAAELAPHIKNEISHRGQAIKQLLAKIKAP